MVVVGGKVVAAVVATVGGIVSTGASMVEDVDEGGEDDGGVEVCVDGRVVTETPVVLVDTAGGGVDDVPASSSPDAHAATTIDESATRAAMHTRGGDGMTDIVVDGVTKSAHLAFTPR